MIDFDTVRPGNLFAYYPNETPLFDGVVAVGGFQDNEEAGFPTAQAEVEADRSLDIAIAKRVQAYGTQYGGYFLRRAGNLFVCNVDLELPEQPTPDVIARALLGAMAPETVRGTEF